MSCYLLMKSALFFRLHAEKQDLCFCRHCFTNHDVWENVEFRSMLIPVYLEWKTNKILVFCLNSQWREWMISICRAVGVVSKIYDPLYKAAMHQMQICSLLHRMCLVCACVYMIGSQIELFVLQQIYFAYFEV